MPVEKLEKPELATPFWVMGLALVLAILLAKWIASTAPDFQNLALGEQTNPIYGSYNGDQVFCGALDEARGVPFEVPNAQQCLDPADRRNLAKRVVWLGNSQLHAINQSKPGEKTAPVLLAKVLRPKNVEMLAFSFPSASLSEMMVMQNFLEKDHHVDVLVIPLFLDDTREQDVRESLRQAVERPDLKAFLEKTNTGRYAIALTAKQAASDSAAESVSPSLQQRTEAGLTERLEHCCKLQTIRSKARGQIEIQSFMFRNWVFNVNPQTVRSIIPVTYRQNMIALEEILRLSKERSTRVITYIPPIRKDYSPPYDLKQYAEFKAQTKALAGRYGARWVDMDALVPGQYWGTRASTRTFGEPEIDFMHYQEPGHALLAKAMLPEVEGALK
jgi:hypothetical protein